MQRNVNQLDLVKRFPKLDLIKLGVDTAENGPLETWRFGPSEKKRRRKEENKTNYLIQFFTDLNFEMRAQVNFLIFWEAMLQRNPRKDEKTKRRKERRPYLMVIVTQLSLLIDSPARASSSDTLGTFRVATAIVENDVLPVFSDAVPTSISISAHIFMPGTRECLSKLRRSRRVVSEKRGGFERIRQMDVFVVFNFRRCFKVLKDILSSPTYLRT